MRDIMIQVYLKISEVPRPEYPPMNTHADCTTKEVKQEVKPTPMTVTLFIHPFLAE